MKHHHAMPITTGEPLSEVDASALRSVLFTMHALATSASRPLSKRQSQATAAVDHVIACADEHGAAQHYKIIATSATEENVRLAVNASGFKALAAIPCTADGSPRAGDAWLVFPGADYPPTPRDLGAIAQGAMGMLHAQALAAPYFVEAVLRHPEMQGRDLRIVGNSLGGFAALYATHTVQQSATHTVTDTTLIDPVNIGVAVRHLLHNHPQRQQLGMVQLFHQLRENVTTLTFDPPTLATAWAVLPEPQASVPLGRNIKLVVQDPKLTAMGAKSPHHIRNFPTATNYFFRTHLFPNMLALVTEQKAVLHSFPPEDNVLLHPPENMTDRMQSAIGGYHHHAEKPDPLEAHYQQLHAPDVSVFLLDSEVASLLNHRGKRKVMEFLLRQEFGANAGLESVTSPQGVRWALVLPETSIINVQGVESRLQALEKTFQPTQRQR